MKTLSELLEKPGRIYGRHLTIPHSYFVDMLARSGFDFLINDRQHVAQNLETAERQIRDCTANGMTPFVRLLDYGAAAIGEAFDIGAAAGRPGVKARGWVEART